MHRSRLGVGVIHFRPMWLCVCVCVCVCCVGWGWGFGSAFRATRALSGHRSQASAEGQPLSRAEWEDWGNAIHTPLRGSTVPRMGSRKPIFDELQKTQAKWTKEVIIILERDLAATQEKTLSAIIFKAVLERSFHPTSTYQPSVNCDFPPAPLTSSISIPFPSLTLYPPTLLPRTHVSHGGGGNLHFMREPMAGST